MKRIKQSLMFSCKQIQSFMHDYLENRLAALTKIRFEWHIRNCKGCGPYFKLYQTAADSGEFFNKNPLPEELKKKTLSFLESEGILDCDSKDPEKSA